MSKTLKRVVRFNINKSHIDYNYVVSHLTDNKVLYNYLLFLTRQKYFLKSKQESFILDLDKFKEYPSIEGLIFKYFDSDNLTDANLLSNIAIKFSEEKKLRFGNTKIIQSTVRKLIASWKSYFALLKKYKSTSRNVNIPRYEKSKYFIVEYNTQVLSKRKLKNGFIGTNKMEQGFKLSKKHINFEFKSFRCFVKNGVLRCETIYEKEVENVILDKNRALAIDFGLSNLATITFNFNKRPLGIKTKDLIAVNQFYNKKTSSLKSKLEDGQHISKQILAITNKRNDFVDNKLGFVSNKIIDICVKNNTGKIIVGWNSEMKNGIDLGRRNNQKFVQLPLGKLINKLIYKAESLNIELVKQEESYTSKASFIDNDYIPTYDSNNVRNYSFRGKRVTRGLYKTKEGKLINADVNGSLNILKKSNTPFIETLEYLTRDNIYQYKVM